ncbi:MAG: hypothetical protein AAGD12_11945 [Pseudomonadota bacterium]
MGRVAGIAGLAWAIVMLAYGLGFYGVFGGEPRPLLLAELLLLGLAVLAPPVVFLLLAWLIALSRRLETGLAALDRAAAHAAARPADGPPSPASDDASGAAFPGGFNTEDLAAALIEAARQTTAQDLAEIRAAVDNLAAIGERSQEDAEALKSALAAAAAMQEELRATVERLEAARPGVEILTAEQATAAVERDEIRAALLRMEERAAAAVEARELLKEERASTQREREELRDALKRMEDKAAAVATDNRRLRAERVAAAAERDEIQGTLTRLEARTLGTADEERTALAELLLRIEHQQQNSERALVALLERREIDDDLVRLRRYQASQARAADSDQPGLPLSQSDLPDLPPLDWTQILRALAFPRDPDDREGFRALRNARRDRQLGECIQAAEDVLTLLSQDGIYMDDLIPEDVPPEAWIAFAAGERGEKVRPLAAIEDEAALALVRGRLKTDPVFRDSTLHFIRRFEPVLRRMAEEARDVEIHALSGTRTGRAFMLLARVHGVFDLPEPLGITAAEPSDPSE